MWIERVRVQGVGAFTTEQSFEFGPGCTVVTGGNGSGKSTLVTAVFGVVFGLPEDSTLAAGEEAWGEVSLRIGSRLFVLRREFQERRVTLSVPDEEETVFEGRVETAEEDEAYSQVLETLLGIGEGTVWTRSGFVRDGLLGTELDGAVRAWMSGEPRGEHETVLARLESNLARLVGNGPGSDPAELAAVRRDLELKRSEVARWKEFQHRLETDSRSSREDKDSRQALEDEALEDQASYENLARFEELTRERSRLEDLLSELRDERDRIRGHVEMEEQGAAQLEREFEMFMDAPTDFEDRLQNWNDAASRSRSLDREVARAQIAAAEIPATRTSRNGLLVAGGLAVLFWFACLGAGAPVLGWLLGPLFGAAGYGAVWYLDRNADKLRMARESELVRLTGERRGAQAEYTEIRKGLGNLARSDDPAEVRRRFRKYLVAREGVERARGERMNHRPLSEVVNAYEQAFSELQVLDTQTRDLVARARYLSGMDAKPDLLHEKVEEARRRSEASGARVEALLGRIEDREGEITLPDEEIPDAGRLMEDLTRLEALERELSDRAAALREAGAALRDAMESYQGGHLERVASRTTAHFSAMTGGRYPAVRLSPQLEPEIQAGDEWLDCGRLSRGSRDQLFLALRLAVNEEVTGDRGFPLLLDEAFAGWDESRLEAARRTLDALVGSGRQAIVLSTDPRLAAWSETRIELGFPPPRGRSRRRAA